MMDKLKVCSCGSLAAVLQNNLDKTWAVFCFFGCKKQIEGFKTVQEAIKAWNCREEMRAKGII